MERPISHRHLSILLVCTVVSAGIWVASATLSRVEAGSGAVAPLAERTFDPRFRPGHRGEVLVRGTPPIVRGTLHDFIDFVETAFNTSLSAAQEQRLRDALETEFNESGEFNRAKLFKLIKPIQVLREQALRGELEPARKGIAVFRAAIEKRMKHAPKLPACVVLREILHRRNQVAWPGKRPVMSLAHADSYLDIVAFVANLGRNETAALTEADRRMLMAEMREAYLAKSVEERVLMTVAANRWSRVKAAWDQATPAQKHRCRWEAFELLQTALPEASRSKAERGETMESFARAALRLSSQQRRAIALRTLCASPKQMAAMLAKGLVLQGADHPFIMLYR